MILLVIRHLDRAAAVGFLDGALDGTGDVVCVHHHFAFHVARRPANRLNERDLAAQESLLVRIQNRHERNLRQVEAFAKQVHADKYFYFAAAQIGQDLDAIHRLHVAVQIVHFYFFLFEIRAEILRHALGERGHEHALVLGHTLLDARDEVVNLPARRLDRDLGIHKAGRANDLLHHLALRRLAHLYLIRTRRCRGINNLTNARIELLKTQRTVVDRRRQTESIIHQSFFPRRVAVEHALQLRHRHV